MISAFPGFNDTKTVADVMTEIGVSRIEGFDQSAPPYCLQILGSSHVISLIEGTWVKGEQSQTWTINN